MKIGRLLFESISRFFITSDSVSLILRWCVERLGRLSLLLSVPGTVPSAHQHCYQLVDEGCLLLKRGSKKKKRQTNTTTNNIAYMHSLVCWKEVSCDQKKIPIFWSPNSESLVPSPIFQMHSDCCCPASLCEVHVLQKSMQLCRCVFTWSSGWDEAL